LDGIVKDLFQKSLVIPWDKTVFGVDNSDIPPYVHMNDVYKIIQGHQMLNITVFKYGYYEYILCYTMKSIIVSKLNGLMV